MEKHPSPSPAMTPLRQHSPRHRLRHPRRRTVVGIVIAVVGLAALALWLVPAGVRRQTEGVCVVMGTWRYAIALPDGDTLWTDSRCRTCSPVGDSLQADTARASGFFVSAEGHLFTSAAVVGFAPDTLPRDTVAARLERERRRLERLRAKKAAELHELDYYAATHNVVDNGYNEVMAMRARVVEQAARVERLLRQVRALADSGGQRAVMHSALCASWPQPAGQDSTVWRRLPATLRQRGDSVLLLRLADSRLPAGAYRFTVGALRWPRQQRVTLGCFGPGRLPDAAPADSLGHLDANVTEGCAVVNRLGQLTGIAAAGRYAGADAMRRLYFREKRWAAWVGTSIGAALRRTPADSTAIGLPVSGRRAENVTGWRRVGTLYGRVATAQGTYAGRAVDGKPEGMGTLHYADGSAYSGLWHDGLREGWGSLVTARGTFAGLWAADTLGSGTWRDSLGVYTGQLNAALQPHGTGTRQLVDGSYYAGAWQEGKRHGFGFAVSEAHMVQAGIWRRDRFRGEQMIYTAERVYGIDISRYQHETGRHVYPIDWKRLRITSLGTASQKIVHGPQDYPVSFVYIKATQGVKIKNRYYTADIAAARRQHIAAGAYHFFSTRCGGREQALHFLRYAQPATGDLPPVLDIEPYDSQIAAMGGIEALWREVLAWIDVVEPACGTRPLLYVSQNFVDRYMPAAPERIAGYPVWIARYGEYKPYVRLDYWQLAADGRVRGIRGAVDINVFNGSRQQFEEHVARVAVRR